MVIRIKTKLLAPKFVKLTIWLGCYHKHETTRFPNHMNEGRPNFKSRSWNKKIKSKNMMCAWCECKKKIITKRWQKYNKIVTKIRTQTNVEQSEDNA
jgi:hypothetical protein